MCIRDRGDHFVHYNMPGAAVNVYIYGFLRDISFAYPAGFEMEAIGGKQAVAAFNYCTVVSVINKLPFMQYLVSPSSM